MVYDYKVSERRFKDDYELKSVIGGGIVSQVRECIHRGSGNKRAVKIYRKAKLTEK